MLENIFIFLKWTYRNVQRNAVEFLTLKSFGENMSTKNCANHTSLKQKKKTKKKHTSLECFCRDPLYYVDWVVGFVGRYALHRITKYPCKVKSKKPFLQPFYGYRFE